MNELTTIELSALSTICGGQDPAPGPTSPSGIFQNGAAPIRRRFQANLGVETLAIKATGQGTAETTDDRFTYCIANTREGTPDRMKCFDSPATTGSTSTTAQ